MVIALLRKLIVLLLWLQVCYADEGLAPYGTVDHPQINGSVYDVHKPYIEPNQGYQVAVKQPGMPSQQSDEMQSKQIMVRPATTSTTQPLNFKSDSWATDSKVERALQHAAKDGKLSYVLDEAKKANVPASVATVAIVESNYNKNAISPKGAGGAWQLMPGTASDYGLSADDRFDFNSSTKVAIQILNDLHQKFGNWALAFAAYNCGDQCVVNALNKNPNAKDIDGLALPKETKQYVHKIVQLNQLIARLDNGTK